MALSNLDTHGDSLSHAACLKDGFVLCLEVNNEGCEVVPAHGAMDIAAAMAEVAYKQTAAGEATELLHDALQKSVDSGPARVSLSDAISLLHYSKDDAIRFGARLGFALALTQRNEAAGWASWAKAYLESAGCCSAAHLASDERAMNEEASELPRRIREEAARR